MSTMFFVKKLQETFWPSYPVCVEAMEKTPHFLIKGGENVLGGYQKCRTKTFLVARTQRYIFSKN